MLSISEFSEMCHLTPQALRFYHAEGLLVPAAVDERTGYRSYDFGQVERAMMVTLLRDAGLPVKAVRAALDEPDRAMALLDRHAEEVRRERLTQDEAIRAARTALDARPEPEVHQTPAMTVATRLVEGTPIGRNATEWAEAETLIAAATADLIDTVKAAGGTCTGRPWRTMALETPEQDRRVLDGTGPFWIVKVPVAAPVDGVPTQQQPAGEELSVLIPGRSTMAGYCTAIVRLLHTYPLDAGVFVNVARVRLAIGEDGVLFSAPLERRPA